MWVTLPTLVLSQLHYIPSSPFFLKAGKSKSWAILSQRVLEPNVFCNHGLADTSEWLLLWPWDPKLDNFRIGEHTFSEGAGGLKPKTVYRSTFNIGKVIALSGLHQVVTTCINSEAGVAFCDMGRKLTEASHETSILRYSQVLESLRSTACRRRNASWECSGNQVYLCDQKIVDISGF